jgi:ubiquinone/menaquinone biosynthesis C-methylase UbiE
LFSARRRGPAARTIRHPGSAIRIPASAPNGTRREYARLAADYDRRWKAYTARSLDLLGEHLAGQSPGLLLDVACGTAALLPRLREWGAAPRRYVGLDQSPEMLAAARAARQGESAALVGGDLGPLPFADAVADTVVCASALHLFPDADAALREIHRVLRPGGRLLLLDWSRDRAGMWLMNAYLRARGEHYPHMYSRAEARDAVRAAGFQVEQARSAAAGWPWYLFVIAARKG